MKKKQKVVVTKNGPYLVSGGLPLSKEIAEVGKSGVPERWRKGNKYPKQENYYLCRCGASKNHPFCDKAHEKINFDGKETASRTRYLEQALKQSGPGVNLTDAEDLCAGARFCELGESTWNYVEQSADPRAKKMAIKTACNCPAGRLVVWDKKTGRPIEPDFEPSISVVEDLGEKVSGPLWLKGGIDLESEDGKKYEKRNRVTLCRCGESGNKPFCDGSHIGTRFNDRDDSLS